jgi:hypothetical protein
MNWLNMTDDEIMDIANPIMDNLMQASTDNDHEKHVKDFSEHLKSIVTIENLHNQCKNISSRAWVLFKKRVCWNI